MQHVKSSSKLDQGKTLILSTGCFQTEGFQFGRPNRVDRVWPHSDRCRRWGPLLRDRRDPCQCHGRRGSCGVNCIHPTGCQCAGPRLDHSSLLAGRWVILDLIQQVGTISKKKYIQLQYCGSRNYFEKIYIQLQYCGSRNYFENIFNCPIPEVGTISRKYSIYQFWESKLFRKKYSFALFRQ